MKYEFVPGDEKVDASGRTVKRLRALVAISAFSVLPGDLGGYIESENNLDQVSDNALGFRQRPGLRKNRYCLVRRRGHSPRDADGLSHTRRSSASDVGVFLGVCGRVHRPQ
jgi:hypothetical protein